MTDKTARRQLWLMMASQSQKEVTYNEAMVLIDIMIGGVDSATTTAPPGSPNNGDAYIIPSGASGVWATHVDEVAYWFDGVWNYIAETVFIDGLPLQVSDTKTYKRYDNGSPPGWITVAFGGATVADFTDLLDVPGSYSGAAKKWVRVNAAGNGLEFFNPSFCIPIACSDETTALTTGAAKVTFRMPYAFKVTAVRASLTTAQASGSIFTVDINEAGTTILSTKLTIDNTEKTSTTAATAAVISDADLADDAEITIDIDQVGDGTATGIKVYLIGYPQ